MWYYVSEGWYIIKMYDSEEFDRDLCEVGIIVIEVKWNWWL